MKRVLWLVAVLLFVLMLLSGVAFLHGSLEPFPTEEQESELRLVYGAAFVVLFMLELSVVAWLRTGRRLSILVPPVRLPH